ncbi:SDR family oxidoreductase [Paracoccus sp. (in: a-proteobacteria)]|uniref:SDR family oxidoreductase n=1 Tax=Paracoccus sp. TaxID=267 RepID=UPI003A85B787
MALLENRTVLTTGALGTIGQAMVRRFAEEGARVIAGDRPDIPGAQAMLDALAPGIRFWGCDLNDLHGTEKAATVLADEVGGIDILVNNAAFVVNQGYEAFSIEDYEKELRINSSAVFVLSRACARRMREKGHGKIINLTSATLSGHWEGFAPYIASKGASYGLVKALSRELGHYGINVNGISPGAVLSEAEGRHFGDRAQAYHDWILERQCLKRRIEPVAIANLAVFLSSPQADMITAQDIHCDGGW